MYYTLSILMATLGLIYGRDTSKTFRSMPAISNSLVNLGKMDISIHFNGKTPDGQANSQITHPVSPFFVPRSEPEQQTVDIERFEPCPCSSVKNFKNPFVSNSPTDMLGKILKSNDLFSFNQEPVISTTCCDSHEHVQEDTVFFDFSPKSHAENPMQSLSQSPMQSHLAQMSSFMLDNILPKLQAPGVLPASPFKPKAIEILFFPKNKELPFLDFTKLSPPKDKKTKTNVKNEIKIVGDRELKNEFKSLKYRPSFPILSMKEENLTLEKKEKNEKKEKKSEMKDEKKEDMIKDIIEKSAKKTTPAPFTASTGL